MLGGILAHQPGIEPVPPALEGEVLTSGLPGKSHFRGILMFPLYRFWTFLVEFTAKYVILLAAIVSGFSLRYILSLVIVYVYEHKQYWFLYVNFIPCYLTMSILYSIFILFKKYLFIYLVAWGLS